jgi:hypothetical protein
MILVFYKKKNNENVRNFFGTAMEYPLLLSSLFLIADVGIEDGALTPNTKE